MTSQDKKMTRARQDGRARAAGGAGLGPLGVSGRSSGREGLGGVPGVQAAHGHHGGDLGSLVVRGVGDAARRAPVGAEAVEAEE